MMVKGKVSEFLKKQNKIKDEAIEEAIGEKKTKFLEALPDRIAGKLVQLMGYRIVEEEPILEEIEDNVVKYRHRWYLERKGEFITGSKGLYEEIEGGE